MLQALRSEGGRRASATAALKRFLFAEPGGYLTGALVTTTATSLSLVAAPHATLAHVMVIYLLGAVLVATRYGVAVSSLTIVSSALCFDYFNIPPIFAFALPDAHSVLTLSGMLLTAVVVCSLIQRLRLQRTAARQSEARTLELCALSLDLSEVARIEELPRVAERHLGRLFTAEPRVLVRAPEGEVPLAGLSDPQRAHVQRAFAERGPCFDEREGRTFAVQPIGAGDQPLGVILVPLAPNAFARTRDQAVLLAACADRVAVAIERLVLGNAARRAQVEAEAERLRNELLSAMSHDLKTPLASILTAGSLLLHRNYANEGTRRELVETIVDETERLNRLVTNLLNVTRLESGKVCLNRAPESLDELVFGVLSRLSVRLEGRAIDVEVPADLPLVSMDSVLVDQVLVNLIENVLRYTPAGSPLDVRVQPSEREVRVEIADRGPGIAPDEGERVFEKFYRGRQAKRRDGGSGLGLTICRAIVRAHGGRIAARARSGGGTVVEFVLPATALPDVSRTTAGVPPLEAHP
jgi:two-component system sensor histidine kinase KdpD